MNENEKTGDEARAAILAARGDSQMAAALARRAYGVGWKPAVYVDGEGAAGRLEGFSRAGGEALLVALERGMKLGGDGEEALFLAMRAGLRIIPVGGEDAAAVWRAVVPPDMPELSGVEARLLEDGWEGLLEGKKDACGLEGGMDIWRGGPEVENPEVVLCEDDVLEEIWPVAAASPGRAEAGCSPLRGEEEDGREGRSQGAPLWAVSVGVCAAALAVAFLIPGIGGKSPAPEENPSRGSERNSALALSDEALLEMARGIRRGNDSEKYGHVMEELRRRGKAGNRACQNAYEKLKERDGEEDSENSNFTASPVPVAKPAPVPVVKPAPVPVAKPAPVPVAKPAPVPVAKPAPVPVAKPAPVPVAKPAPVPVDGESFPTEKWTPRQKELYKKLENWTKNQPLDTMAVGRWQKELYLRPEEAKEVVDAFLNKRKKR